MMRMAAYLASLWKTMVNPPPHPMAREVEHASEEVVRESKKLGKQMDAFATMVSGLRGERPAKRSTSKRARR